MNKVLFNQESINDFKNLPIDLQIECKHKLEILKKVGVNFGIPLENKYGRDLRGYYKIYFNQAKHRIIYGISDGNIEIIQIIGIGERKDFYIYNKALERIDKSQINK